ncbi:hypothetical protein L9F63_008929, partial [Diploptera punctata]
SQHNTHRGRKVAAYLTWASNTDVLRSISAMTALMRVRRSSNVAGSGALFQCLIEMVPNIAMGSGCNIL